MAAHNDADEWLRLTIRERRHARRWSQADVAALVEADMSRGAIADIERGVRRVSFGEAVALGKLLGFNLGANE